MKFNPDEVIAWLIVGALAGSLAGMIVKRRRAGFGRMMNLAVGLIGAVIGGCCSSLSIINLGMVGSIMITSEEVVESFIGALIFLAIVWIVRKCGPPRTRRSVTSRTPIASWRFSFDGQMDGLRHLRWEILQLSTGGLIRCLQRMPR